MPKYIVTMSQACWVSWDSEIEAENEEAAIKEIQRFYHDRSAPHVGEACDHYDIQYDCREAIR